MLRAEVETGLRARTCSDVGRRLGVSEPLTNFASAATLGLMIPHPESVPVVLPLVIVLELEAAERGPVATLLLLMTLELWSGLEAVLLLLIILGLWAGPAVVLLLLMTLELLAGRGAAFLLILETGPRAVT
jgi:hypothetical protein